MVDCLPVTAVVSVWDKKLLLCRPPTRKNLNTVAILERNNDYLAIPSNVR